MAKNKAPSVVEKSVREINGVYVTILPDRFGPVSDPNVDALTNAHSTFITDDGQMYVHQAVVNRRVDENSSRTTRRVEWMPRVRVTIQTTYTSIDAKEGESDYGRGTTPEDIAAGNTTLGFHESCHRSAYLEFIKTNPSPSLDQGNPTAGAGGAGPPRIPRSASYEIQLKSWGTQMLNYSDRAVHGVGRRP